MHTAPELGLWECRHDVTIDRVSQARSAAKDIATVGLVIQGLVILEGARRQRSISKVWSTRSDFHIHALVVYDFVCHHHIAATIEQPFHSILGVHADSAKCFVFNDQLIMDYLPMYNQRHLVILWHLSKLPVFS